MPEPLAGERNNPHLAIEAGEGCFAFCGVSLLTACTNGV